MPMDDQETGLEEHSRHIVESIGPAKSPELDRLSREKCREDFGSGGLVGPFYDLAAIIVLLGGVVPRLLRCFSILEQHGGAEEASCRVIDDGLAGGQNAFTGTSAYHRACDLDMWVLLLRIAAEFFGSPLQGSTSDFKSAYRQVTAAPEQARYFVVAMWDPASRRVAYELAVSQLFGSGAAPPSFRGFRHGACLSLAAPLLCLQTTAWTTSSLLRLRFLVSRHFLLGVRSP